MAGDRALFTAVGGVWAAVVVASGEVHVVGGCTLRGQRNEKWPHWPHFVHGLCSHSHATRPHPRVWHVVFGMFCGLLLLLLLR